jgi:hypothetical protein
MINSANRREQQRREDAKKELANGKLGGGFGFTSKVKVSDFGEMATIALFFSLRVFASSLFNWGIGPAWPARGAAGKGNWDQPRHTTCRG